MIRDVLSYIYIKCTELISFKTIVGLSIFLSCIPWITFYSSLNANSLQIVFFDVGQGDAAMVLLPGNIQLLIDTGPPGSAILSEIHAFMPPHDRMIESVFISHAQADHVGALRDIFEYYSVQNVYLNDRDYLKRNNVDENQISVKSLYADQKILIGDIALLSVLWPDKTFDIDSIDPNYRSQILRLEIGRECVLFMGDAEVGSDVGFDYGIEWDKCRILKSPHHGSKNAVTEDFLNKLEPEYAIISVGKNSFGHPSNDQISLMEKMGILVLRTDQEGTIHFKLINGELRLID